MQLPIYHYVLNNPIPMVKKPQVERKRVRIQSYHPAISQIIKALHMPTRSMKERVLMRESREFAKEADSIPLIESFLVHLETEKRE